MARTQARKKGEPSGKKATKPAPSPAAPPATSVNLDVVRALRTAEDWSGLIELLGAGIELELDEPEAARALLRAFIQADTPESASAATVDVVANGLLALDGKDVDALGAKARVAHLASDHDAASKHALDALHACKFQDQGILAILQESQKSAQHASSEVRRLARRGWPTPSR